MKGRGVYCFNFRCEEFTEETPTASLDIRAENPEEAWLILMSHVRRNFTGWTLTYVTLTTVNPY